MTQSLIPKLTKIVFSLFFLITLVHVLIFDIMGNHKYDYSLPLIALLFIGILGILLLFFCLQSYKGIPCTPSISVALISFSFFIFLVFISYNYYFITGWDCIGINNASTHFAQGFLSEDNLKYLSRNPNNNLIVILYSSIIKIFNTIGFDNSYFECVIFQCFIFSFCAYLTYRIVGMLSDKRAAIISYVLYILLVGLSPWVIIPYSDGTGLLFPTLFIFLFLKGKNTSSFKGKLIYYSLIYLMAFPAYKIKAQTIIVIISITISLIYDFLITSKKKSICFLAVFILSFFIGLMITKGLIHPISKQINKEMNLSSWYYLYMGANVEHNGICNPEDQDFSLSFNTKNERDNALKEAFVLRMKENGFAGTVKLISRKNFLNHYDGSFGWWLEGGFYAEEVSHPLVLIEKIFGNYYYKFGNNFSLFMNITETIWLSILFMASFICFKRTNEASDIAILLALLGLALFEMIFECRARYLFTFVPLYIVSGTLGFNSFLASCKEITKGNKTKTDNDPGR